MTDPQDIEPRFASGGRYRESGDIGRWWLASFVGVLVSAPVSALAGVMLTDVMLTGMATRGTRLNLKPLVLGVLFVGCLIAIVLGWLMARSAIRSRRFTYVVSAGVGLVSAYSALAACLAAAAMPNFPTFGALVPPWLTLLLDPTAVIQGILEDTGRGVPMALFALLGGVTIVLGATRTMGWSSRGHLFDEQVGRWFPKGVPVGMFLPTDDAEPGCDPTVGIGIGEPGYHDDEAWIELEYLPSPFCRTGSEILDDGSEGPMRNDLVLVRQQYKSNTTKKAMFRKPKQVAVDVGEADAFWVERAFVVHCSAQWVAANGGTVIDPPRPR